MSHLVIVGGTRGLGRVFAELMRPTVTNLTLISRTAPSGHTIPSDRERHLAVDVRSSNAFAAALKRAVVEAGPINSLAMFQQHRGEGDAWESKLACTLGATRIALEAPEHFATDGQSAIVLLTSNASRFACTEQDAAYHAAKTGLLGLCRYYACQLGRIGIRVNCVSPGTVLKPESQQFFLNDSAMHDRYIGIIPLRRMGTALEVAKTVRYLLSTDASFITGQEIVVDGGAGLVSQESFARTGRI